MLKAVLNAPRSPFDLQQNAGGYVCFDAYHRRYRSLPGAFGVAARTWSDGCDVTTPLLSC